jgi:hypothetical protein
MSEASDPYQKAGLVLILAAMLFLILAFLGAGQTIAPLLIVSSLGLFLTGILLLTFTRGQTPDPAVFSFLDVQHQANTATLLFRAGCRDPPVFIPYGELEGRVGQFHALPSGSPLCREAGAPPASHGGRTGILLPPACLPLMGELETRFHLRVPADPGRIPQLIEEVAGEILEIAARVVTAVEPGEIRVDLLGFALYPGCRAAKASPQDACLLSPCTICSLIACLAVRATGRDCQIVSMDRDDRQESVHLVISFNPRIREPPAEAAPVTSVSRVPKEAMIPVPVSPVTPAPGIPVVQAMVAAVSPVPGEPEAPGVMGQAVPFPDTLSPEMPGKPEVPPWWSGHPGTRRLRYLRGDEVIFPVPAEKLSPVPVDVVSPVPAEAVPPVPAGGISTILTEAVIPEGSEEGSLSMADLVARVVKDLVPPPQVEPAAMGESVPRPLQEAITPSPMPREPVSGVIPDSISPLPHELEPMDEKEPDSPLREEPEVPAWWSGHPGTRRLRYLRCNRR